MSLLGEELAEEWLNRQGYFTIRGAKVGTGEIDLLAVRHAGTKVECWHYEVQASLRPISYLCPAPHELRKLGKAPHNAKKRTMSEIVAGVKEWIDKKYKDPKKEELRKSLWPGKWNFGLIVGNVKHQEELEIIANSDITIRRIADIIKSLSPKSKIDGKYFRVVAASGSDLIDLIFAKTQLKEI
jgi:hypothetical protein